MTVLFGLFLVAHGLVHGLFLVPPPPDADARSWPFDPAESWLLTRIGVGQGPARGIAAAFFVGIVAAFGAMALAWIGVLPMDLLRPVALVATVASLALLGAFFHRWLALGLTIDAVLLAGVLVAGWAPR